MIEKFTNEKEEKIVDVMISVFMTLLHNSLQSFPFIQNFGILPTEQFFHIHLRITNYNINKILILYFV